MPRTRACAAVRLQRLSAAALAAAALALAAPAAGAQGGTLSSDGGPGGVVFVEHARITKVTCARGCASHKRARPGSTILIRGKDLTGATIVAFLGTRGKDDDLDVKVRGGTATRLRAKVPHGAITGPIVVQISPTDTSRPSKPVAILPPLPPDPNPTLTPAPGPRQPGSPRLETGTSRTRAFYGARRTVVFQYRLSGARPTSVTVQLLRNGGTVVRTWNPADVAPGTVQTIVWNGNQGRSAPQQGRYSFHLTAAGGDGAIARSAQAQDSNRDAFDLYGWFFPIRGAHDFRGGGGRFGAGRAGHTHQGQDTFAKCGTPLVAARGGKVKLKAYHSLAGNYIVVDAAGTGTDYAYMHLAEPSPFRAGDRVYTGQRLGSVGDTGDAKGCHLHMELWSSPGWHSGGHPFDPLPSLQAWDAYS